MNNYIWHISYIIYTQYGPRNNERKIILLNNYVWHILYGIYTQYGPRNNERKIREFQFQEALCKKESLELYLHRYYHSHVSTGRHSSFKFRLQLCLHGIFTKSLFCLFFFRILGTFNGSCHNKNSTINIR